MSKISENTFGMRIKNAEDTISIINSFIDFKPLKPEDAPAEVGKAIALFKEADQEEAVALQQYSVSTDTRTKLVSTDADSIKKSVSLIRSYLKVVYDKNDKQFTNINNILNDIMGFKSTKDKKNLDEKSISTSQKSFASITQFFSDLIATLSILNLPYAPTNESITLESLKKKQDVLTEANTNVTKYFNTLTNARQKRNSIYTTIKDSVLRLKKTVQSQYGNDSSEYKKIKSIKV